MSVTILDVNVNSIIESIIFIMNIYVTPASSTPILMTQSILGEHRELMHTLRLIPYHLMLHYILSIL